MIDQSATFFEGAALVHNVPYTFLWRIVIDDVTVHVYNNTDNLFFSLLPPNKIAKIKFYIDHKKKLKKK